MLGERRIRTQEVVGEQAEKVAYASFLGGRPSGQTRPGGVGLRCATSGELENIHMAGTDRITGIDCRHTPNERHQVLCAREVWRGEGRRPVR